MNVNTDNHPEWYNCNKLKGLYMYRDYDSYVEPTMKFLGCARSTAKRKINTCTMDHEDTIAIARGLKMTPREYCECFLQGVFEEIKDD